ncbi:hypothetical protein [Arthrobacter sp. VKM Ac-2550]|uniref:hypothetical protein n=1 Tax=Crystallibacter permensis TaxID=1938888 RepID=UPI002226F1CB|nr:hypothetical protein [Arthrobacter sp. VKM Ac-2550]MCW2134092.1 hypothetical protein [Arthrobacter sp. VKM Ac-2550]
MKTDASTDEEFLRQLLDESDVPSSDTLHDALLELRAAGSAQAAPPSTELAAFLSPKVTPLRPRRRAARGAKGAMIGVAVAAATGLGVTGVAAASPEFRSAADQTVQQVASFFNNDDGGSPVQQTTVLNPGQDGSKGTDEDTGKEQRAPGERNSGSADANSDSSESVKPREPGEPGTGGPGTSRSGPAPSGKQEGATRREGAPLLDRRSTQNDAQPVLPMPEVPGDKVLPKDLDDRPGENKLPLPAVPERPAAPQKTDPAAIPDVPVLPESAVDGSN